MKSDEEIMEMLDAFDLTKSYRDAAELVGCSHNTVEHWVVRRDAGELTTTPTRRDRLIDAYLVASPCRTCAATCSPGSRPAWPCARCWSATTTRPTTSTWPTWDSHPRRLRRGLRPRPRRALPQPALRVHPRPPGPTPSGRVTAKISAVDMPSSPSLALASSTCA